MSKSPSAFITAPEALALFMERHRLHDAAMATLVDASRTGITKLRSGERDPSLALAARLEHVTGIPAAAWQPFTEDQGRVAPARLKTLANLHPAKPKPAKALRRTATPATA
ncbi:MAG: hypothetical protein K2X91_04055 [Thermoleophilia bacterium]|nr:hypothetical protein [Thermoleophilia bacterium]